MKALPSSYYKGKAKLKKNNVHRALKSHLSHFSLVEDSHHVRRLLFQKQTREIYRTGNRHPNGHHLLAESWSDLSHPLWCTTPSPTPSERSCAPVPKSLSPPSEMTAAQLYLLECYRVPGVQAIGQHNIFPSQEKDKHIWIKLRLQFLSQRDVCMGQCLTTQINAKESNWPPRLFVL